MKKDIPPGLATATLAAVGIVVWMTFSTISEHLDKQKSVDDAVALQQSLKLNAQAECKKNRAQQISEYSRFSEAGKHKEAAAAVFKCGFRTEDNELADMYNSANLKHLHQQIKDKSLSDNERISHIRTLQNLARAEAEQYNKLLASLEQKVAAVVAREKKSKGVAIGFTAEDILASSWGKPERINRSVSAHGSSEQWVYPGANYLYLRNGVLETIHTRQD